jgi:hypothetical protein
VGRPSSRLTPHSHQFLEPAERLGLQLLHRDPNSWRSSNANPITDAVAESSFAPAATEGPSGDWSAAPDPRAIRPLGRRDLTQLGAPVMQVSKPTNKRAVKLRADPCSRRERRRPCGSPGVAKVRRGLR